MPSECNSLSRLPLEANAPFPTTLVARSDLDILKLALRSHLHQPAIALWRATEFVMLRNVTFPSPVLDLGCGNGEVARSVLRSHWPLDGLEFVPDEAHIAHTSNTYRFVIRASAVESPFLSESYGSVYSHSVLEHIPDDLAAIAEAARVLRPGGRLIFTIPSPAFASRIRIDRGEQALADINLRLGHYHYRSIDEWTKQLGQHGFEVVTTDGHLPAATQEAWLRLDALMVQRVRGRRVLDWLRAVHRRQLMPVPLWVTLWSGLLWRSFRRPVDEPGGYLIVAELRS